MKTITVPRLIYRLVTTDKEIAELSKDQLNEVINRANNLKEKAQKELDIK